MIARTGGGRRSGETLSLQGDNEAGNVALRGVSSENKQFSGSPERGENKDG